MLISKQKIQTEGVASNNEKNIIKFLEFSTNYKYLPTKLEEAEYAGDGTLGRVSANHQFLKGGYYLNYQVIIFAIVFIVSLILGLIANRKTFSKSKEDKIYLIILLSYFILMLLLDNRITRNFAIASFGGLQIGWIIKEILKRKSIIKL